VRFREGADPSAIERIQGEAGVRILKAVSGNSLYLMKIMDGSSVEDALDASRPIPKFSMPNRTTPEV